MEKIRLGLDFGTSNTSAATMIDNQLHLIPLQRSQTSQPSGVFLCDDGHVSTGYQAIDDYLKNDPKAHSSLYVPSIKQGLPLIDFDGVSLKHKKLDDGRYPVTFFEPDEIASAIIADVTAKASDNYGDVHPSLVMGRPVRFSANPSADQLAESRLVAAAKRVGYTSLRFVLEPVAAAIYYENTHPLPPSHSVFVFDFGGGTLDTCVMTIGQSPQNRYRVIASHGITLGGSDLDKDIFNNQLLPLFGSQTTFSHGNLPAYLFTELTDWHLATHLNQYSVLTFLKSVQNDPHCSDRVAVSRLTNLIEFNQVPGLLRSVETAKIALSASEQADIAYQSTTLNLRQNLTRADYSRSISSRTREINGCIDECLNQAGLTTNRIDTVLRVGGSSRNIFVSQILGQRFDNVINDPTLTSVASGLGLVANGSINIE